MSIFKKIIRVVDELDLKIEKIQPTRNLFPFLHHVHCRIVPDSGREYIGRGIALTESIAFEKAIGEALERYCHVYSRMFSTTNGMALHTDVGVARAGAFQELLERDAYLCHFYTRTPFYRFESDDIDGSIFEDTRKILKQHGFELKISRLSSAEEFFIAAALCCGADGTKYGFSIGLACKKNSIQAIDCAILETLSHLPGILAGELPRILTKHEFQNLSKVEVHDVAALAMNPDYRHQMNDFFSESRPFLSSDFNPSVTFHEVIVPPVLKELELFVVKAASSECQELFFSSEIRSNLNHCRLSSFMGRSFEQSALADSIHFFA